MSSLGLGRPSTGQARGNHPRQSSGAWARVFDPAQVQTFREAFNLIDQDNDGIISEADLKALLASLGQTPTPSLLSSLLTQPTAPGLPPGQLTFTTFVTLMASHLSPLDPEPDLVDAFASFDEGNTGFVKAEEVREGLKSLGDRLTDEEIDRFLHPPFLDPRTGLFNYRAFCSTLRVTDDADGEAVQA
ncbi:hypothetical protein JCM10207_006556 [Rhodosporidiobolus poonsookiae]